MNGPGLVEIQVTRHHAYRKAPSGRGCVECRQPRYALEHIGHSESLNALGDGNRFAYRAMKTGWEQALTLALEASDLPRALERVTVEGLMCFPDRRRRDQGNHRFIVEKALGDALVTGGWLADDSWDHYEFGGLRMQHIKSESWTRLMLFPAVREPSGAAA